MPEPLKRLALADPALAGAIAERLRHRPHRLMDKGLAGLVDHTLWALSVEENFGRAVGLGLAALLGQGLGDRRDTYCRLVAQAAASGPTLGRFMAVHLVAVLQHGLLDPFGATVAVMLAKGTYTLEGLFDRLNELLESDGSDAARAYLELLRVAFGGDLPYGRCRHLAHALPQVIMSVPVGRRAATTRQITRLMAVNPSLADAFIDGLANGLDRLDDAALARFVDQTAERFRQDPTAGRRFAALASQSSHIAYQGLQTAVALKSLQARLNRYVQARTAMPIVLRPLAALRSAVVEAADPPILACTDGRSIYLAEQMAVFDQPATNALYYRVLAALEAAYLEWGTFGFDLQKAGNLIDARRPPAKGWPAADRGSGVRFTAAGDLTRFFNWFPDPELAAALFAVSEHGRLHTLLEATSPGLMQTARPLLQERFRAAVDLPAGPLEILYARIALKLSCLPPGPWGADSAMVEQLVQDIQHQWQQALQDKGDICVEIGAVWVAAAYDRVAALVGADHLPAAHFLAKITGRGFRPDLFDAVNRLYIEQADRLQKALAGAGLQIDRWPLIRHLIGADGLIGIEDLNALAAPRQIPDTLADDRRWRQLLSTPATGASGNHGQDGDAAAFWYPEWDLATGDYLRRYCRVVEKPVQREDMAFHHQCLMENRALVQKMRRAFELIKPAALQWQRRRVEGEIFDLGALVDFAVARRVGSVSSDRIYNRRVSLHRSVAVLLLLDLSRSTAQACQPASKSVLEVEKAALVLFGEALAVLGDDLAIAGFSSSGRLQVNYHCIKDFADPLGGTVWGRIGGLTAGGATRMGGAIRHAAARLRAWPAAVRLLIILSDGFPNDVDYKKARAAADTRKALAEAHGCRIYTHGITVAPAAHPALDDLYGTVHHTTIADARDLPDKLLRVYGSLTRS